MGTMRGGMGMGMRAERSPHGRGARAGQADVPKKKPDLKKIWPQVRALVAPRKGCSWPAWPDGVNRVAGLVLPFTFKAAAGQGAVSRSIRILSFCRGLLPSCLRPWWCRPSLRSR